MEFATLSKEEKIKLIEKVLDEEVRPFVERDGGGVVVEDINENNQVVIAYQGACVGCYAAIGGTLSYIDEMIKQKVDPNLSVVPNME